ncbi:required for drug-induced death protein 1 [Danio aesculapii]|uniref:required for drug-induced death protein 1 n=1 Tax=Danio aesculapii TaxID=1142201 RepID=UPI0024C0C61E|nr:required for drug-induced death protein 1 [Danio aesculapii]
MKPKSLCVPRFGMFEEGRYRRQVDAATPEQSVDHTVEKKKKKRPREPQFTALTERPPYELLLEDDSQHTVKEEKKAKKKEKYKKYKKNVGKALRYSWKCLMLGLQNFTVGYSTPFSTASSIIPDFHPGGAWG